MKFRNMTMLKDTMRISMPIVPFLLDTALKPKKKLKEWHELKYSEKKKMFSEFSEHFNKLSDEEKLILYISSVTMSHAIRVQKFVEKIKNEKGNATIGDRWMIKS